MCELFVSRYAHSLLISFHLSTLVWWIRSSAPKKKVGQLLVKQYHSTKHKKKTQWTKSKEFLDTTILQFLEHPLTFCSSNKFYQPIIDLYITPEGAWRDWPWFGGPSNVFRICPKLGAQKSSEFSSCSWTVSLGMSLCIHLYSTHLSISICFFLTL